MNKKPRTIFSKKFKKTFEKLDFNERETIIKYLKKIEQNPSVGKPLKYSLKGFRSSRIGKYRLIYEVQDNIVRIHAFKHRKKVYNE